ncbi:MAG: SoxR reducing system RseC family protein [Alphaproteobacteria bacterium]|nr:SoxR reducing system RseC family protein [Alphaproteobacteria bacterium]
MSVHNQPITLDESSVETVAVVIALEGDMAVLAAARKSACESCASAKGCGVSALAGMFGNKKLHFTVPNSMDARIGDAFIVGISQKVILKMASIAYLLPLTGTLAGAIGSSFFGASDLGAACGAVLGLIGGLALAQRISSRGDILNSATPTILRPALSPDIAQGKTNCDG